MAIKIVVQGKHVTSMQTSSIKVSEENIPAALLYLQSETITFFQHQPFSFQEKEICGVQIDLSLF